MNFWKILANLGKIKSIFSAVGDWVEYFSKHKRINGELTKAIVETLEVLVITGAVKVPNADPADISLGFSELKKQIDTMGGK